MLGGVWWSLRFWVGLLIFAQTAWRKPALKPIDPARVHGAHPVDVVHIGAQLDDFHPVADSDAVTAANATRNAVDKVVNYGGTLARLLS